MTFILFLYLIFMNTQLDTLEKDFSLALQSIETETELKELEQEYL